MKGDILNMKKLIFITALILSVGLAACGGNEATVTADQVIQQFKDDGLEIGEVSDLESKEYGNTRQEGKRILVPSLGEDAGGRLFVFKDEDGMNEAKSYYDELGNGSPMLYSHTHANGVYLLQMNGDMSDEDFAKYADSLDKAVAGE